MMDLFSFVTFARLAFITVIAILIWRRRTSSRLPPSPFQIPVLGCLPFLDPLVHRTFSKWAKKFGKIFCCRLGGKLVVVLNDAKLIREAFSRAEFNGRPHMYTAEITSKGYGISFASDDTWSMHRRFAFKTFHQLVGRDGKIEERIHEEADHLIDAISKQEGKPFQNKNILQSAVGNVIGSVLFSQNFQPEDADIQDFYGNMNNVFKFFPPAGVLNIFPVLRIIPSIARSFGKVIEALDKGANFIRKVIESRETLGESCVSDYTDAFIRVQNKEQRTYGKTRYFTDEQFVGAARELFLTGYDTTTSTLRWAFLHLLKYPNIRQQIQKELDSVVGASRPPTFDDIKDLPYLQAFLYESVRMSSIAPLGIPHRAVEDSELCGYFIPKDTWVMANIWHIHHDENVWGDPEVFRPERFLSNGEVVLPKHFIPFSIGKRACPGESLAKMEIFLFLTRVLQRFDIEAEGEMDFEPVNGFSLDTQNYLMKASAR